MANPVGEESWLAYLDETVRSLDDLEQRVNALELHKRAAATEPGSLRIWLAYCNYLWSLWADCQSDDAGWEVDEQAMGRELFPFSAALDLWQQGYEAVKYRLDDSHTFWDRWVSLEMELLEKTKTPDGIRRITHLYRDRLLTPHLTWDETSQKFSSFLSEYNRAEWEDSMKDITSRAQDTKRLIAARDRFENKLRQAARGEDIEAQKAAMTEYLEWEMLQSRTNKDSPEVALDLCCGLYARALTGIFAGDEDVWHDYIIFRSSAQVDQQSPQQLLDILRRAVQHCPWSGRLWSRYILCAEEARLPFVEIESIKHAATSENQLFKDGMESMIEVYVAWCGFLKRRAMEANATDESVDVADVGLTSALEDVEVVGQRLYGKDFQGDPKFRIERIYIQYLTEKKKSVDVARQQWDKLASIRANADSHDFWFRYYMWEMLIFSSNPSANRSPTPSSGPSGFRIPTMATSVLRKAAARRNIDWPEKVLEVYLQHCNDYETPHTLRQATDMVHRAQKGVKKRRDRELQKQAAAYASYQSAQVVAEQVDAAVESPGGSKRKRDSELEAGEEDEGANKRHKNAQEAANAEAQGLTKRDRENSTVIVKNLPAELTQTKLRQYFKAYGHINNITALVRDEDGQASTAMIEFRTTEEAQSALLRDGKYFGESQISVQSGYDLTVYIANYPPIADEKYIRELFKDCGDILSIRWPSLKVNTHRRFCYISFRDREASAKAIQKEGTVLDEKYRLLAKYSDPGHKKNREGAVAEGREVHISNLDWAVTEAELRQVFSKYGTVSRVNLPQNLAGKNRGFAFIDLGTKEEVLKAVEELNNTKFRSQIIRVEASKESKVKASAKSTNVGRSSASPAPSSRDAEGDEGMRDAGSDAGSSKPSAADIAARTIALMGIPDTVNDARVLALLEPLGAIVRFVLQPAHGGAKIEFADAATAGKATLHLDGLDFEGQKLRIGSLEELRHAQAEHKSDRIEYGSSAKTLQTKKGGAKPAAAASVNPSSSSSTARTGFMPPPTNIRRPTLGKAGGPKRGLGFVARKPTAKPSGENGDASKENGDVKTHKKSNADFKALMLGDGGATSAKKKDDEEKKIGAPAAGGAEEATTSKEEETV